MQLRPPPCPHVRHTRAQEDRVKRIISISVYLFLWCFLLRENLYFYLLLVYVCNGQMSKKPIHQHFQDRTHPPPTHTLCEFVNNDCNRLAPTLIPPVPPPAVAAAAFLSSAIRSSAKSSSSVACCSGVSAPPGVSTKT